MPNRRRMLEVVVTLCPATRKGAEQLFRLEIVNDETGTDEVGNYDLTLFTEGESPTQVRIENVLRDQGPVSFVTACLRAVEQYLK